MIKQLLKVAAIVLITGGLVLGATYLYVNRPKATPVATVSQKQYNALVTSMQTHDAIASVKSQQLTAQIQAGDAKLASTCSQLKLLKAVNPNCQ